MHGGPDDSLATNPIRRASHSSPGHCIKLVMFVRAFYNTFAHKRQTFVSDSYTEKRWLLTARAQSGKIARS